MNAVIVLSLALCKLLNVVMKGFSNVCAKKLIEEEKFFNYMILIVLLIFLILGEY